MEVAHASEAAPPLQVPPAPKLRDRHPGRSAGASAPGGEYADEAAFEADDAAWLAESKQRGQQMRVRERVQDQLRDRRGRQRGTAQESDNERRVRQKREQAAKQKQLEERYIQERARVRALLFEPAPSPAPAPAAAAAPREPWTSEWMQSAAPRRRVTTSGVCGRSASRQLSAEAAVGHLSELSDCQTSRLTAYMPRQ